MYTKMTTMALYCHENRQLWHYTAVILPDGAVLQPLTCCQETGTNNYQQKKYAGNVQITFETCLQNRVEFGLEFGCHTKVHSASSPLALASPSPPHTPHMPPAPPTSHVHAQIDRSQDPPCMVRRNPRIVTLCHSLHHQSNIQTIFPLLMHLHPRVSRHSLTPVLLLVRHSIIPQVQLLVHRSITRMDHHSQDHKNQHPPLTACSPCPST